MPFTLNGVSARVLIDYRRDTDPASLGCPPEPADFLVCTATMEGTFRG